MHDQIAPRRSLKDYEAKPVKEARASIPLRRFREAHDQLRLIKWFVAHLWKVSAGIPAIREYISQNTEGWFVFGQSQDQITFAESVPFVRSEAEQLMGTVSSDDYYRMENARLQGRHMLTQLFLMAEPGSEQRLFIIDAITCYSGSGRRMQVDMSKGATPPPGGGEWPVQPSFQSTIPIPVVGHQPRKDIHHNPGAEFQ